MPLSNFQQVLAIGLNYRAHMDEVDMEIPSHPLLFHKSIGSLSGPDDDILLSDGSMALDWEVELAVVIRKRGRRIAARDSAAYIGGFCLSMDVSERDWQFNRGGREGKGKSYDSFTPVGPWLLTKDEMSDPQNLRIWLSVNGAARQESSTSAMVYNIAHIIEHISTFQTLMPGDLILTGTPAGVGHGMKPPTYLKSGDEIVCGINCLGEQRHIVVSEFGNRS